MAAAGFAIGSSLSDSKELSTAKRILDQAKSALLLPVDAVVAPSPSSAAAAHTVVVGAVPEQEAIFDLGPASTQQIVAAIKRATTIVWNGPLGYCELPEFSACTIAVAEALRAATTAGALTVIGGGDTLEVHARYQLPMNGYSFVSTGGGAMLEFLAHGDLPALAALRDS